MRRNPDRNGKKHVPNGFYEEFSDSEFDDVHDIPPLNEDNEKDPDYIPPTSDPSDEEFNPTPVEILADEMIPLRLSNPSDPKHSRNDNPDIPELNHISNSIPDRHLPVNYIDMEYHRKNYFLHHVSKPGTYQMDLMFDGQKSEFQCYLVAINVNTRKLYAQSTKIPKRPKDESEFVALGYSWKNAEALKLSLDEIVKQIHRNGNDINLIIMDGEKGMYSKTMDEKLNELNIDIRRVDIEVHTSLALIDRVIRTIRDMNYKEMRGEKRVITPDVMNRLVWIYNNKPHKTLSKFFKKKVTPNEMDSNIDMEKEWIKHLHEENYKTMFLPSFQMKKGSEVHLWQPPEKFVKRRSRLQKEIYTVEGSIGGNYLVKNKETGQEKLYPRWAMKHKKVKSLEPKLPKTSYEIILKRSPKDVAEI